MFFPMRILYSPAVCRVCREADFFASLPLRRFVGVLPDAPQRIAATEREDKLFPCGFPGSTSRSDQRFAIPIPTTPYVC